MGQTAENVVEAGGRRERRDDPVADGRRKLRTRPLARAGTTGYDDVPQLASANATLQTLGVDLQMAGDCVGADLVHSHTWYANMAGHLASLLGGMPHVVTAHSLEPMRPWKAEQLGGGYRVSSWAERTAYESAAAVVAVSAGMRADILKSYPSLDPARVHVVHNGIDSQLWSADRSAEATEIVRRHGVDPDKRSVVFVGRITRQKGLPYLLRACAQLPPDVQLVLCAGAPDTPEIEAEVRGRDLMSGLPKTVILTLSVFLGPWCVWWSRIAEAVAAVPSSDYPAPWALVVVPLVPFVIAVGCVVYARSRPTEKAFDTVKKQLNADMAMLREVSAS